MAFHRVYLLKQLIFNVLSLYLAFVVIILALPIVLMQVYFSQLPPKFFTFTYYLELWLLFVDLVSSDSSLASLSPSSSKLSSASPSPFLRPSLSRRLRNDGLSNS